MTSTLTNLRDALGVDSEPEGLARLRQAAAQHRPGKTTTVDLLSPVELRALTDYPTTSPERTDVLLDASTGGRLAPRFRRVPVNKDGSAWSSTESSRTNAAAPTPFGTAVGEASLTMSNGRLEPARIGVWTKVEGDVLQDGPYLEAVVADLLTSDFLATLDAQVAAGDGTGESLLGVVNDPDVTEQPLGTDNRTDALVKAAAGIRTAGHAGPIDVAAHPDDLVATVTEVDGTTGQRTYSREALDALGVRDLVPSAHTPAGSPIVGDLFAGGTLYLRSPLSITFSNSHGGLFTAGRVAVLATARVSFETVRPSALRKVSA